MDPKFNGIVWTGSTLLDVQNPDPALILVTDIARALSRKPRFGGHTRDDRPPYSVAWHSLFCEKVADAMGLPVWVRLQALFHDAPEYVLGDFVTPLKVLFPAYQALEANLWRAVAQRISVPVAFHPAIGAIDRIALQVESASVISAKGQVDMEIGPPPSEWADMGARWVEFSQSRALPSHEAALSASLFTSTANDLIVTQLIARTSAA